MSSGATNPAARKRKGGTAEVFLAFLKLGFTSFGGPVAHLGYFRSEFVERRRWLDETTYADVVALCQFLPGPASSQVGMTLGVLRAGLPGAFAAWTGFTMPSAAALILFAYGVGRLGNLDHAAWLHGLKIVAVAVVAQAVWGMARNLCPDRPRVTLAAGAALLALAVPSAYGQISAIVLGGLIGWRLLAGEAAQSNLPIAVPFGHGLSIAALLAFFVLLFGLPLLVEGTGNHWIALLDSFYRSGALVFGGGHVVLPLLQKAVIPPGWAGNDLFLAGYGATQAVPGPLFTFAAYLGAVMRPIPERMAGRPDLPRGDLPAVLPAARRGAAALGGIEATASCAIGAEGRQCRRGWAAVGRALYTGLDKRHLRPAGFCGRVGRVHFAGVLVRAAVACCDPRCTRHVRCGLPRLAPLPIGFHNSRCLIQL